MGKTMIQKIICNNILPIHFQTLMINLISKNLINFKKQKNLLSLIFQITRLSFYCFLLLIVNRRKKEKG